MSSFDEQEKVCIYKSHFDELVQAQKKLDALEAAGVDNWEWYGDAMQTLHEDVEA